VRVDLRAGGHVDFDQHRAARCQFGVDLAQRGGHKPAIDPPPGAQAGQDPRHRLPDEQGAKESGVFAQRNEFLVQCGGRLEQAVGAGQHGQRGDQTPVAAERGLFISEAEADRPPARIALGSRRKLNHRFGDCR
jgi:hypothetical protein